MINLRLFIEETTSLTSEFQTFAVCTTGLKGLWNRFVVFLVDCGYPIGN